MIPRTQDRTLILDLETVPLASQVARIRAEPFDEANWTAPANYKDPEKIAAKLEKDRAEWEATKEGRIADLSLSPRTGRIVVAGLQRGSERPILLVADTEALERQVIAEVWDYIGQAQTVVTFGGHHFDLPFLINRSVLLNAAPDTRCGSVVRLLRRYTYSAHFDCRMALTNWDRMGAGTLDDWCEPLGFPRQTTTGRDVWPLYQAGDLAAIAEHCASDLTRVTHLYQRLAPYYLGAA